MISLMVCVLNGTGGYGIAGHADRRAECRCLAGRVWRRSCCLRTENSWRDTAPLCKMLSSWCHIAVLNRSFTLSVACMICQE